MKRKLLTFAFILGAFASTNVSMASTFKGGPVHDFEIHLERLDVCIDAAGYLFDSYIREDMDPEEAHERTADFFQRCVGLK